MKLWWHFVAPRDGPFRTGLTMPGSPSKLPYLVAILLPVTSTLGFDWKTFIRCVSVHSGFLESYTRHRDAVYQAVMSLTNDYPGVPVVVTGHSLGGALAAICAMDVHYNFDVRDVYLINFGSPRVGDYAFSSLFQNGLKGRSWRVTHDHDIVPHVPIEAMDFHHIGTEVWYTSDNTYEICNGSGEDPNCSNSNHINLSVADHMVYLGVDLHSKTF
eukprot:TRINITY_DN838_c0_g1_i1.p1 TRINITY_DN838_c0_g1~~TRINITY_DN838_c0_g1_i1.p1  ORF type:complete len:215 (-),score=31.27 TRINITY_DN838_c0_g1_i1:117-761(-)